MVYLFCFSEIFRTILVQDAVTKDPISGATVTLIDEYGNPGDFDTSNETGYVTLKVLDGINYTSSAIATNYDNSPNIHVEENSGTIINMDRTSEY